VYLTKLPHPANFRFARRFRPGRFTIDGAAFTLEVEHFAGDVCRLEVSSRRWAPRESQAVLTPPESARAGGRALRFGSELTVIGPAGRPLLSGVKGATFGVRDAAWMLCFEPSAELRFYGLGEKWGPLEKTGVRTAPREIELEKGRAGLGDKAR
jgi:hypothetical protein